MTHIWISLLLIVTAIESTRGTLCIGDERCVDTIGTAVAVAPSDRERTFVWTSADGTTVRLGVLAPKAQAAVLDGKEVSSIELAIEGDDTIGWPAAVSVGMRSRSRWRWTIPGSVARLQRIVVPRGVYALQLTAERHRAFVRNGLQATDAVMKLGDVKLMRSPVALGVAVDAKDQPIPNAVVLLPDAETCATANEQGAFACELKDPLPEALVVSASGYGPREVRIARNTAGDLDFGRVVLGGGRALKLKIVRPEAAPAKVSLFLDPKDRYEHSKLKTVSIREREEEVRFDAGGGRYQVLIAGEGPLERLEVPITIEEGDVEKTITIEPFTLIGTARFGDAPLTGNLELLSPEHTWRATTPIANGTFGGTVWQTGAINAFVTAPQFGQAELVRSPVLGADPSRWDLQIERRVIAGRVVDASTGAAVPEAQIDVVAETGDSQGYFSADVKPDGSYEILAHRVGSYTLRVNSKEHVPLVEVVQIVEDDRVKKVDLRLDRGVVQPLEIVTPAGTPIANALILEGVQPDRVNPQFINAADGEGRFSLRGKPAETRVLYIVPREGSFAVLRTTLPRSSDQARPLVVTVPAPLASLRVRSVDAEGNPKRTPLLFRYNGEFVPAAILRFVTGDHITTAPAGDRIFQRFPAGAYEIWALLPRDRDEVEVIASNGTLRPPVRVGLSVGESSVTVTVP